MVDSGEVMTKYSEPGMLNWVLGLKKYANGKTGNANKIWSFGPTTV